MKKVIIFLSVLSALLFGYAACRGSATPAPAQSQPPAVVYSTNTPGPTDTPAPVLGKARDKPYPMGQAVDIGTMTLTVMFVTRPANQIVADGNMFNDTPEPDKEYILVDVRVECKKPNNEQCSFGVYQLKTVGANGRVVDQAYAAGVPNELESAEFFGGAAIEGAMVYLATTHDDSTVLMYEPLLFGDPVYFALK